MQICKKDHTEIVWSRGSCPLCKTKKALTVAKQRFLSNKRTSSGFTLREEAIIQEAFMTGRIYSHQGEQETPGEIQRKLRENCEKAIKRSTK